MLKNNKPPLPPRPNPVKVRAIKVIGVAVFSSLIPPTLLRYAWQSTMWPTLLAGGVLLGLVWLLQSLRFLDFLINKGLGLLTFLNLTVLMVPMLLTIIVPLATLVGAIMACRRWQDDNELTAVLAAGISPWRVVAPIAAWGALASLGMGAIYLVALPKSTTAFKNLQTELRTQQGQLLLEEGTFNQLGNNLMIYLKQRVGPTAFEQLLVHDTRNAKAPVTWYAKRGAVQVDAQGQPRLVLEDGMRQEVAQGNVNVLEFGSYNLDISSQLTPAQTGKRPPEIEEWSMPELAARMHTSPPAQAAEYRAEWHKRLSWPWAPLALTWLACAWLMHVPHHRTSSVRGVVGAGVCGVVYMVALFGVLGPAQGGAVWALAAMWALPAATIGASLWVMAKRG